MNANIIGQKYDKKQDIGLAWEYLFTMGVWLAQ